MIRVSIWINELDLILQRLSFVLVISNLLNFGLISIPEGMPIQHSHEDVLSVLLLDTSKDEVTFIFVANISKR